MGMTRCCGPQVNSMELTEGEYERLWATNVKGTFELSRRLVPLINEGVMPYYSPCAASLHSAVPCHPPRKLPAACRKGLLWPCNLAR